MFIESLVCSSALLTFFWVAYKCQQLPPSSLVMSLLLYPLNHVIFVCIRINQPISINIGLVHRYRKAKIDCLRFVMCPLLAQLEIGFFSSFSAAAVYSTNEANKAGLKQSIIFRCLWPSLTIQNKADSVIGYNAWNQTCTIDINELYLP